MTSRSMKFFSGFNNNNNNNNNNNSSNNTNSTNKSKSNPNTQSRSSHSQVQYSSTGNSNNNSNNSSPRLLGLGTGTGAATASVIDNNDNLLSLTQRLEFNNTSTNTINSNTDSNYYSDSIVDNNNSSSSIVPPPMSLPIFPLSVTIPSSSILANNTNIGLDSNNNPYTVGNTDITTEGYITDNTILTGTPINRSNVSTPIPVSISAGTATTGSVVDSDNIHSLASPRAVILTESVPESGIVNNNSINTAAAVYNVLQSNSNSTVLSVVSNSIPLLTATNQINSNQLLSIFTAEELTEIENNIDSTSNSNSNSSLLLTSAAATTAGSYSSTTMNSSAAINSSGSNSNSSNSNRILNNPNLTNSILKPSNKSSNNNRGSHTVKLLEPIKIKNNLHYQNKLVSNNNTANTTNTDTNTDSNTNISTNSNSNSTDSQQPLLPPRTHIAQRRLSIITTAVDNYTNSIIDIIPLLYSTLYFLTYLLFYNINTNIDIFNQYLSDNINTLISLFSTIIIYLPLNYYHKLYSNQINNKKSIQNNRRSSTTIS